MSNVVIFEPAYSGHVLVFVRLIATSALERGARCELHTSLKAEESLEFRTHLSDVQGLTVIASHNPTLRSSLRAMGPGNLVVPHADPHLASALFLPVSRSQRMSLLVMRDPAWEPFRTFRPRTKADLKHWAIRTLHRKRRTRVFMLRQPGYVAEKPKEYFVSDPVLIDESKEELESRARDLRRVVDLSTDVRWVGLVGGMQLRKNPLLVAQAVHISRTRDDFPVGIAYLGPWPAESEHLLAEIRNFCRENDVPLRVHNALLSNAEFNAACVAVDIVVMAYSSHSPNSTLGKCAALGQRLAAAGSRSIARFVEELGHGPTSALEAGQLSTLICQKLTGPAPQPQNLDGGHEFGQRLLYW